MKDIQIFNNPEFGEVRTVVIDDEPWFVGKDVAAALKYEKPTKAVSDHVDEEDKKMGPQNGAPSIVDKLGRQQYPTFINESGFYALVLSSKLPSAQKFKHWVTNDVLPSIRKHGAYMTTDTMARVISDPDFAIGLLQALKAEQEKSKDLEARIEREKPMTELGKAITSAEENISIGDMAKILRQNGAHVGRTRLFEKLRDDNLLQKSKNEWNIPTQKAMESGLFHIKETTWTNPATGFRSITKTTEITPKGQSYFIAKYL